MSSDHFTRDRVVSRLIPSRTAALSMSLFPLKVSFFVRIGSFFCLFARRLWRRGRSLPLPSWVLALARAPCAAIQKKKNRRILTDGRQKKAKQRIFIPYRTHGRLPRPAHSVGAKAKTRRADFRIEPASAPVGQMPFSARPDTPLGPTCLRHWKQDNLAGGEVRCDKTQQGAVGVIAGRDCP